MATRVVLLAGQSNMVGIATYDGLGDYPTGVLQYNQAGNLVQAVHPLDHYDGEASTQMGLAISFSQRFVANNPSDTLVLVPCGRSDTGFVSNDWNPGDTYYTTTVNRVNSLMTANPAFVFEGILWQQGEKDAQLASKTYKTALDTFIDSIRTDISVATSSTPFTLGLMCADFVGTDTDRTLIQQQIYETPVRKTYTAVANSVALVGIVGNNIHYDAPSLRKLGERHYSALQTAKLNASNTAPYAASIVMEKGIVVSINR